MKKYIIFGVIAVSLVIGPRFVSAQSVEDLQTQIQSLLQQITSIQAQLNQKSGSSATLPVPAGVETLPVPAYPSIPTSPAYPASSSDSSSSVPGNTPSECLKLQYNLYFGQTDATTNGEVSKLQKFLQWMGEYDYPTITGYYGPSTEAAVKRFQVTYNIVSSGSPDTTGWGAVGPKTAKVIQELSCKPDPNAPPSLTIVSPNAGGMWIKGVEYTVTWKKVNVSSSKDLKISLVPLGGANEYLLKTGVDNDLKANVKVSTTVPNGLYYVKIAGVVDGVVVSDLSDQVIEIKDAAPEEGTLTASPMTVLTGSQSTIQFSYPKNPPTVLTTYVKMAFDCPALVSVTSVSTSQQNLCGAPMTLAAGAQGYVTVSVLSTSSKEEKVKVSLWAYKYGPDNQSNTSDDISLGVVKSLNLNVLPPFTSAFTITSPNGGETWEQGTTQTVTWEKVNIGSQKDAKLLLESTNGTQYVLKTGVDNDLKTSVTVPKDISVGSYKVVIQANVNGVIVKDASDGYISIVAPNSVKSITVLTPNGGENWKIGDTKTISWKTTGNITTVNLLLEHSPLTCDSSGNCNNPPPIVLNTANSGSYAWTIPATYSIGDYKLVIQEAADTTTLPDTSDSKFSIVAAPSTTPSLTVLSPNGGELYEYGKEFTVTWSSANIPAGQMVTIAADNVTTGAAYTFAYQTPNDGKQSATLPGVAPTGTYKVRIYTTVNGATVTDSSDASFTITQDPSTVQLFTVLSPNGGELWVKGTNVYPTWTDQNISSDKKVDLYLKNTATSKEYPFALSVYNDGKTTDPKVTSDVLAGEYKFIVRATLDGKTVSDESDQAFTVADKAQITSFMATDPSQTSSYSVNLNWTSSQPINGTIEAQCPADSIKLLVKENNNTSYHCNSILVNYSSAQMGNTVTVTPQTNTKSVSVDFVFKANQGTYALDAKKVTVVFPATKQDIALNILTPNGGETFEYGKNFTVTWASTNIASSQLVTIVGDNITTGIAYTFAYQTPNDGSQSASLPSVAPAGTYKIRVYTTVGGTTVTDTSDGTITITQTPSFTLLTPKGGEVWVKGNSYSVTWTDLNIAASKNVDLYFVNASGGKYVLVKSIENDGAGTPQVKADVPAGTYYVQIEAVVDTAVISDKSDGMITVSEKPTSLNDDNNATQLAAILEALQAVAAQLQALIASQ
jgi:hypothetical protein